MSKVTLVVVFIVTIIAAGCSGNPTGPTTGNNNSISPPEQGRVSTLTVVLGGECTGRIPVADVYIDFRKVATLTPNAQTKTNITVGTHTLEGKTPDGRTVWGPIQQVIEPSRDHTYAFRC